VPVRELRRRVALAGALALLLAACGKKGEPDPPPGSKTKDFPKSYPPPGS